jgi:hypothetical protein
MLLPVQWHRIYADHNLTPILNTIILIIPLLLLISGLEWFLAARKGKDTYTAGNFAHNLAIGRDRPGLLAALFCGALFLAGIHVPEFPSCFVGE